jgi:hypothetical protein
MSINRTSKIKPEIQELINKIKNENNINENIKNKNMKKEENNIENIEKIFNALTLQLNNSEGIHFACKNQKEKIINTIYVFIQNCENKIKIYETYKKKMTDHLTIINNCTTENEKKLLIKINIKNFKEFTNLHIKYDCSLIDVDNNTYEIILDINIIPQQYINIVSEQQREIYLSVLNIFHHPENYIISFNISDKQLENNSNDNEISNIYIVKYNMRKTS